MHKPRHCRPCLLLLYPPVFLPPLRPCSRLPLYPVHVPDHQLVHKSRRGRGPGHPLPPPPPRYVPPLPGRLPKMAHSRTGLHRPVTITPHLHRTSHRFFPSLRPVEHPAPKRARTPPKPYKGRSLHPPSKPVVYPPPAPSHGILRSRLRRRAKPRRLLRLPHPALPPHRRKPHRRRPGPHHPGRRNALFHRPSPDPWLRTLPPHPPKRKKAQKARFPPKASFPGTPSSASAS